MDVALSEPLEVVALDEKVRPWPLPSSLQALVALEPGSFLTRRWAAHLFKDWKASGVLRWFDSVLMSHHCVTMGNRGS